MKLFLIRHGESEGNLGTRYTGQTDVKLTENGQQQAMRIRPILANIQFDKVYSSDLSRAADTCAAALPGMAFERMALLREFDVGSLVGKEYASVERIQPDDPTKRPDHSPYGGEDAHMVRRRAREFLEILEKSGHDCVAAFSHHGFINCLLKEVLEAHYENTAIKTGNCAIHVLEYNGHRWRIVAINYMTPIE